MRLPYRASIVIAIVVIYTVVGMGICFSAVTPDPDVTFMDAVGSVDLLNNGNPFQEGGSAFNNDDYMLPLTDPAHLPDRYMFQSQTFDREAQSPFGALLKFSDVVYLIPGYVYTLSFDYYDYTTIGSTPITWATRGLPVRLVYAAGSQTSYSDYVIAETTTVTMDIEELQPSGYRATVKFQLGSLGLSSATKENYYENVGATGVYYYNGIYIDYSGLGSSVNTNWRYYSAVENFSLLVDNSDDYNNFVLDNVVDDYIEKEEQEIEDKGNQAIEDTTEAMPENNGTGVISALGNLISAFSYLGEDAVLPIPQVSIPAISGMWEKKVLIEETELDFGEMISNFPSGLMLFLQASTTIALIIWCIKELWNMIQYFVSLRGG